MTVNFDFKKLGLNKYEEKVYITLVREGLSTILTISKKSGVPHAKTYTVLGALEQKQFVKKYAGIPKRYIAVEPHIVTEIALKKKSNELKNIKQKSSNIIKQLSKIKKPKTQEEDIEIIEGYKNYLNVSVDLHKLTQSEWCSTSRLSTYKPHIDSYKTSIKRGVKIRMITSLSSTTSEKIKIWKNAGVEIRTLDIIPTKFSISDDKITTLRFTGEQKYVSLIIKNKSLAESMKEYFNMLWKEGKKI